MSQAAKKLCKIDILKFIIPLRYGQPGWPGKGSKTVLSKVKIYYTKSRNAERLPNIHRYQVQEKIHPEKAFLDELRDKIDKEKRVGRQMKRIEANLVQNYSPCSKCADAFAKLNKHFQEREGIKFSLNIKFANFYCHYEKRNRAGLKKLLKNGVAMKLLQGEDDWKAFLNDKTFVELSEHEKIELLDRAKSEERKENEKQAIKIFNNIEGGAEKIGKTDIEKFIVQHQYGEKGWDWPKSTIVLSTVKIYYTTGEVDLLPGISTNKPKQHAEKVFLAKLKDKIKKIKRTGRQITRIEVKLVQNYSPCSDCANALLKFMDRKNREGIQFSFKIEFANFYKDWVPANLYGLKKLEKKGVRFELLQGEEKWKKFLDDKTFVRLTDDEKTKLLDRAESKDRKKNEDKTAEIFDNIGLANTCQHLDDGDDDDDDW